MGGGDRIAENARGNENPEVDEAKKKQLEEERKKKEKMNERMLKAPTFVLLEMHEIEPFVHEVRLFWRPHKPAEYADPIARKQRMRKIKTRKRRRRRRGN